MLKYLLFILFSSTMIAGYFSMNIPSDTPFDEMLTRVQRGIYLVFTGGLGSLFCLHKITR